MQPVQQAKQAPAPQPGAAAQPGAAPQGKGTQAPPEVVAAFQRIVAAAGKVVYEKDMTAQIVQMIGGAQDPVQGVVKATMTVLDGLRGKVNGINPDFVYTAATVVALMLLELAEAAKIIKFDKALIGQVTQGLMAEIEQRAGAKPPAQGGIVDSAQDDAPHGEMPVGGEEEVADPAEEVDPAEEA